MRETTHNRKFLTDALAKVEYLDFGFVLDSINSPTDAQVAAIGPDAPYFLRPIIRHYGGDNDNAHTDEKSWQTFYGYVPITEWSENAVAKAVFVALVQKLRHEASETFKFDGGRPFHEHRTPENVEIPK